MAYIEMARAGGDVDLTAGQQDRGDEQPRELHAVPTDGDDAPEKHRIERLEREVEELRKANEILRRVARFLARPRGRTQPDQDVD